MANVMTMPKLSETELLRLELARLQAENDKLKQNKVGKMKVSEKGALSVYGMGRFPVTLYKSQWLGLLDSAEEIRKFIVDNDSSLKSKGD